MKSFSQSDKTICSVHCCQCKTDEGKRSAPEHSMDKPGTGCSEMFAFK